MKSVNPATGQVIKEYREHTLAECLDLLSRVAQAWPAWKSASFPERAAVMKNVVRAFRQRQEQYARLITQEMGKIIGEARAEVEKSAWVCDYYAGQAEQMLADEVIPTDCRQSFITFEPLGPVLAIMPWNYPFWQVCRFAAPALMAGNAVVLKHASNVPGCALALEEAFRQAGFPEHIFQTLLIPGNMVEPLIAHEAIKAVTLTGSDTAGRQVAVAAGKQVKKTVLELGGADPYIVLEDADLDRCCATAVKARMHNVGQTCIAAKRFIVTESVAAEFTARQLEIIQTLRVGDPLDENTQVGPLAREDLLAHVHEQVQESLRLGARLLTGGKRMARPGFFYTPTVLTGVRKGMPVFDQEVFGPVTAIVRVRDEEDAIRVANDSPYGLGASLWTQDLARGERLARQIEAGTVFINGMTRSDPRLPFGGIKQSGYGRELSHYGIKEFVNIKTICLV